MKLTTGLFLSLLLFSFHPGDACAEAEIGLRGLGGRISYVNPRYIDGTIGFGGLVDLGTFAPQVGFGATLDAWFNSQSSVDFRDIILGINSRYWFTDESSKLRPYAGAGPTLHLFYTKTPAVGHIPEDSDTDTLFGIDLFGGTTYRAGSRVDILGDLMYRFVSDVGQLTISGGVVFLFGP